MSLRKKDCNYRSAKFISAKKPLTFQGDITKNKQFVKIIQESITDEKQKQKTLDLYEQANYRRDLDNALFYFSAMNHGETFDRFLSRYAPKLKGKITLNTLTQLKLKQLRL